MTEEAPNFTEQSWFVGQDVKNKDSHVNLLFDLKSVIASVGKTESWTVQMQFLVFVEAANDTNARCRWTGRSRWRRTAAPRSAGRSPTAPPSLWRAGTDWKRAREGVSERGERNNKGIQLLWTRQGQWLQSWHCLSTLVRLLLTQLNPALRLIWLLGAIRSRILMLIKSPAGTEASTEKKKGASWESPSGKVPAGSVTPWQSLESRGPTQQYSSSPAELPPKHNLNFSSDLSEQCRSAAVLHVPPFELVESVAHP